MIKGQGIDIKSLSSRSVLTVTNMTEDRYGNYTCVASNKLGTANASVPLIRELFTAHPPDRSVARGFRVLKNRVVDVNVCLVSDAVLLAYILQS